MDPGALDDGGAERLVGDDVVVAARGAEQHLAGGLGAGDAELLALQDGLRRERLLVRQVGLGADSAGIDHDSTVPASGAAPGHASVRDVLPAGHPAVTRPSPAGHRGVLAGVASPAV